MHLKGLFGLGVSLLSGFTSGVSATIEKRVQVCAGIDLGTTFSCVCLYLVERREYIFLRFGPDLNETVPSTVYAQYTDSNGNIIAAIGYSATELNSVRPQAHGYFYGTKRLIGISDLSTLSSSHPELANFASLVSFAVRHAKDEAGKKFYEFPVKISKKNIRTESFDYTADPSNDLVEVGTYTPFSLAFLMLAHFKTEIDRCKYEILNTVITTPAYFDKNQDDITRDAAVSAGFPNVKLSKEPVAACVCYSSSDQGLRIGKDEVALVFDLGGGTFDMSVVDMSKMSDVAGASAGSADMSKAADKNVLSHIEVVRYKGDNFLGGENFNDSLFAYFKGKIAAPLNDVDALRLRMLVESFKISLCNAANTREKSLKVGAAPVAYAAIADVSYAAEFVLSASGSDAKYDFKLTLREFDSIVSGVYNRIESLLKDLFTSRSDSSESPIDPSSIEKVILVGGSTRIPYVRSIIRKVCPKSALYDNIDPDKAVARGAAEIAANDNSSSGLTSVNVVGSVPLSIGIKVYDGSFVPILAKDSSLPCDRKQIFTTYADNQTAMAIEIAMGSRPMFADNTLVGSIVMNLTDKAPKGVPQIEITLEMNEAYEISVHAKELSSNKVLTHKFDSSVSKPTQAQIDAMIKSAADNAEADLRIKEVAEKLQQFDATLNNFSNFVSAQNLNADKDADKKALAETILTGYRSWLETKRPKLRELPLEAVQKKLEDLQNEVKTFTESCTTESKPTAEPQPEAEPEKTRREGL